MRHNKAINHLGRKSGHRKAMMANMATSLIMHKRITTTVAKAKALKTYVEPLITKSKEDTTHSRRIVFSYLKNKEAIKELFGVIAAKVADRPGGYSRVLHLGFRQGDGADMALIELVDFNEAALTTKKEEKKSGHEMHYMAEEELFLKRPIELDADVVRFQNNKEKWIAFIGLINGRPYEIFTGLADDEEGIFCPKSVTKGKIIKAIDENGNKRYDFQFINKRGYKTTIEGLSDKFNPEFWNYAKLISGVLRYGMPIDQVLKLVGGLELDSQSINTWKMGVERALKKYLPNGTKASGQKCPNCGAETLIYQEGCLICTSCGTSKCG